MAEENNEKEWSHGTMVMLNDSNWEEFNEAVENIAMSMNQELFLSIVNKVNFRVSLTKPILNKALRSGELEPTRMAKYAGEAGLLDYKNDLQNWNTMIATAQKAVSPFMSKVWRSTSMAIKARVQVHSDFKVKYLELDYLWLLSQLKHVSTGEGTHSLHLVIIELGKIRMSKSDYNEYFNAYTKIANKVKERMMTMTAEEITNCILDTTFIVNIMQSNHDILKTEVDKILQSSSWEHYYELISRWGLGFNTATKISMKHIESLVQAFQTIEDSAYDHQHET